ncbi:DUF4258 domain-containing protein [Castellaniella sp. MT123]|uniref:DUF4258 domain-containing protein n=1 Tax=Castellaniella sp. MT123 TaxID=3140381 RepID=UPI0031F39015
MIEPIPFKMSDVTMLRIIRHLAKDSGNVYILKHARTRMQQRKITISQVLACLRGGSIHEPAHQDIDGSWKCTLRNRWAGDEVHVAAALHRDEKGDWIAVVTVF